MPGTIEKWESIRTIETKSIIKTKIRNASRDLKTAEVFQLLSASESFRSFFTATLVANSFEAFYWEVPPVSITSLVHPCEFVQTNAPPLLGISADPNPFSNQFKGGRLPMVLSFENLGGDALLIAPTPISDTSCYGHLASFLRAAPFNQVQSFWKITADSIATRIAPSPIWFWKGGVFMVWPHVGISLILSQIYGRAVWLISPLR